MTDQGLTAKVYDDSDNFEIDPFELFQEWFEEAKSTEINDPGAMTVASVDASGMPDARILLLNGHDQGGFVFFTNLESTKGSQLEANAKAAAVFHWKSLRRQVRIRGTVEHVSDEQADAYFATRPLGSRIGAHASQQSRPLESREVLLERTKELEKKFGQNVPRPKHWSGYRIVPLEIEFWKNGEFRLHDRVVFRRAGIHDPWERVRLNP